ncbi:Arm DNA-binding domain-containing protein [Paenibacillus sp. KR2-11]|uniref:Arm DNA-binding domain-containing protein n=1 Tax=Paenibacillus sp. KR2-11 TaxID=3385500 RepID=UPI0038FC8DDF
MSIKGYFYRTSCKCGKYKRTCDCRRTGEYRVDIGKDPQTGKRRRRSRSGFKTQQEAMAACNMLLVEMEQHIEKIK